MSTITLLTVMQVISDRKTVNLKELMRLDTDRRASKSDKKDQLKMAVHARIDECDKILNLLKDQFYVTPARDPSIPINRSGSRLGQLFDAVTERTDKDALGEEEKGTDGLDMVAESQYANKHNDFYASPLHALQGPHPLHPV